MTEFMYLRVPKNGADYLRVLAGLEHLGGAQFDCEHEDITAAVRELVEAATNVRRSLDAIGGARAWLGTMGDDGQGHDEGSILAEQDIARLDAALAELREGEETPVERGIQRRQIGRASRSRPNESEETKP